MGYGSYICNLSERDNRLLAGEWTVLENSLLVSSSQFTRTWMPGNGKLGFHLAPLGSDHPSYPSIQNDIRIDYGLNLSTI